MYTPLSPIHSGNPSIIFRVARQKIKPSQAYHKNTFCVHLTICCPRLRANVCHLTTIIKIGIVDVLYYLAFITVCALSLFFDLVSSVYSLFILFLSSSLLLSPFSRSFSHLRSPILSNSRSLILNSLFSILSEYSRHISI